MKRKLLNSGCVKLDVPQLRKSGCHWTAGERKVQLQRTEDDQPTRSFDTLLADRRTLTKNETRVEGTDVTFDKYARPTPLQEKAFSLLGVSYRL